MEPLYDFGLAATRWLQETYPHLQAFFTAVSATGRFEFFLAVLPLLYWCFDKRLGATLTYLVTLSVVINSFIKHPLRAPRPYWLDASLGLGDEETYGLPSNHVQSAAIVYFLLAGWFRQRWLWLVAFLMVIIMALSRIYLGVHFVHDTVGGFLLGVLVLVGFYLWRRYVTRRFNNTILGQRLLAAIAVPIVLAVLYVAALLILGEPNMDVPWAEYIEPTELGSIEASASYFAVLLGLGIGFLFEGSRVRFMVDGPIWKRALRYVLGMIVVLAIWKGLGAVFPADPLWLAIPLRILRYFLLAIWAAYYAPLVFVRLGLAQARSEPESSLNIKS